MSAAIVAIDGVEYEVPLDVMSIIKRTIKENGAKVKVNDVDAGIYELLQELVEVDWKTLIADDHTAALISLGLFIDQYGTQEAASELSNVEIGYFTDRDWNIGGNAVNVLDVVNSGDF